MVLMDCCSERRPCWVRRAAVLLGIVWVMSLNDSAQAGGLTLEIRLLSKSRLVVDEPIWVEMTLVNEAKDVAILPYLPADVGVQWRILDTAGVEAAYIGNYVKSVGCRRAELEPGMRLSGLKELTRGYGLAKAGLYRASAVYSAEGQWEIRPDQKPGPPNWTGKIESNTIDFTIGAVPADEEEAHRRFKALRNIGEGSGEAVQFLADFPGSPYAPHVMWSMATHTLSIAGKGKDPRSWQLYYGKAAERLRLIQREYPDFLPDTMAKRVQDCEQAIAEARATPIPTK